MADKQNHTYSKKAFVVQSIQMVNTVLFLFFYNVPLIKLPISYSLYLLITFVLGIFAFAGIITGSIGHRMLKKAKMIGENNKYINYARIMSTINIIVGCIPVAILILIILYIFTAPVA